MNKKHKNILIISLIIFIIILTIAFILLNNQNVNHEEVDKSVSLITTQQEKEKNFKIEGYTIDNPNVI